MSPTPHSLDLATRLEAAGPHRLTGVMHEAYGNFAGPFGG